MPLFLTVGNSSIRFRTSGAPPAALPADVPPQRLAEALGQAGAEVLVAASVNPAAEQTLAEAARAAGLAAPLYAGRDFPSGVPAEVDNPDAVGIDRLLNVAAAWRRARRLSAAVDFGTAVSISVAGDGGAFVGGAILPGLRLSLDALARGTAFLPALEPDVPQRALGRDTREAILSGTVRGTAAAAAALVESIGGELGRELAVFATGGDAGLLRPLLPTSWEFVDVLTLEGLELAWRRSS